jgi:hypothetical protein
MTGWTPIPTRTRPECELLSTLSAVVVAGATARTNTIRRDGASGKNQILLSMISSFSPSATKNGVEAEILPGKRPA